MVGKMLANVSGTVTEQAGWQFLGSTKLASAASTTASVSIAACDMLIIEYMVTGYSGNGVASFRFNGDAAGTSLYMWRFLHSLAGGVAWVNTASAAAAGLIQVGPIAIVTERVGRLRINNFAGVSHAMTIDGQSSATALSSPTLAIGEGEYSPAGGTQITSVVMVSTANNLNAGSGFAVYGINL